MHLTLSNFRNYVSLSLPVPKTPVVLTGSNGAGKTNLLEALSFFSPGRGMRRATLSHLQRQGAQSPWGIHFDMGDMALGTGLDPKGSERRIVTCQGVPLKTQSDLTDYLSVLWLTPQMDRLFLDAASQRRRFVDRLVYAFDPLHARRVSQYEEALRERSRLLNERTGAWVDGLEKIMAEHGVAIATARQTALHYVTEALQYQCSPFPRGKLSMEGRLEEWLEGTSALEAEECFQQALRESRPLDRHQGGSLHGPHKSDFTVFYTEKDMPAALCSTGEQKALLLSIILASARLQAMRGARLSLLLLDEVVAHLDEKRRCHLFDEIKALNIHCWMTGTDESSFGPLGDEALFLTVENGTIQ